MHVSTVFYYAMYQWPWDPNRSIDDRIPVHVRAENQDPSIVMFALWSFLN